MTTIEGSLTRSGQPEQPGSRNPWQRLWTPERQKYWLISLAAAALIAVAAVILVLTLGGSGKFSAADDDLRAATRFSPAATAAPTNFISSRLVRSDQALTIESSASIFGGAPIQSPAALAVPESEETDSYLAAIQRQVISQAALSVEVTGVASAVEQVRAIAESLGGFVEQLSSSGVAEEQRSTLTIRVPQVEFFNAFDRIKLLGEVVSENAGSEDVTGRFIDLEARLKSAQREEESLLALLGRADKVGEILTIERELARVRTELERLQGQLNFLERRVDLATITVSLFAPQVRFSEPPSGSITLESADVARSLQETKALIVGVGGELDQVFTSVRDGRMRASLTARVFADDFGRVMESIESQGNVVDKDVREGSTLTDGEIMDPETPRSVIDISFEEAEPSGTNQAVAAGAPAGGVGHLLAVGPKRRAISGLFHAANSRPLTYNMESMAGRLAATAAGKSYEVECAPSI